MYGLRVFEAWATAGSTGRRHLEVADPLDDGVSLMDRVEERVASMIGRGLLTGVPDLLHPDQWNPPFPPETQEPQVRFEDVRRTPQGHVFLRVQYGLYGEFDRAIGGDGGEVDLRNRTPVRDHRALLLMPAHGTQGRLVVETVKQRCPVTMLVRWLGLAEYQHNEQAWVRLKTKQCADRARIRAMISNAERVSAELTQKRPSMPGQPKVQRRLVTEVENHLGRAGLIDVALSWLDNDEDRNADEYVVRIEEIAGYDPEDLDEVGLRFNSGAISVINEKNEKKTINPESIRDKFTYPVSENLPLDDESWIRRAREVLSGTLTEGTDIQV